MIRIVSAAKDAIYQNWGQKTDQNVIGRGSKGNGRAQKPISMQYTMQKGKQDAASDSEDHDRHHALMQGTLRG